MKKYMKSSKIKKIVVKCANFWMDEFEIDSEIFDDVYVEAATRAVEKRQAIPGFKVGVIIECWEKKDFTKPLKHICYNTYRVLINAGLHDKAEMMRANFIKMYGTDLRNESLKGDNNGTTTNIQQSNSGSIGE
jgi:hypothetical protein